MSWKERIELDAGSRNLLLKALKMDIKIYKIFKTDKRNSQKIPDFRNFPVQDPRKKYFALDLISINIFNPSCLNTAIQLPDLRKCFPNISNNFLPQNGSYHMVTYLLYT